MPLLINRRRYLVMLIVKFFLAHWMLTVYWQIRLFWLYFRTWWWPRFMIILIYYSHVGTIILCCVWFYLTSTVTEFIQIKETILPKDFFIFTIYLYSFRFSVTRLPADTPEPITCSRWRCELVKWSGIPSHYFEAEVMAKINSDVFFFDVKRDILCRAEYNSTRSWLRLSPTETVCYNFRDSKYGQSFSMTHSHLKRVYPYTNKPLYQVILDKNT